MKAWPNPAYGPSQQQGSPQEARGVMGSGAQLSSHLPPHAVSYLHPPVNVYKAGPAASWSDQRPDPCPALPSSCWQRQGRGTGAGRKRPGSRCLLRALSFHPSMHPSPAVLPRSQVLRVSSWFLASSPLPRASPLTGGSCQAEQGGRYF